MFNILSYVKRTGKKKIADMQIIEKPTEALKDIVL